LRQTVESHLLHHLAIPDTVLAITRAERLAPLNYARAFAYVHPIALAIDATDILSHSRSSSCFGSLRYGSLLIKRVTLPLRLANLFRGTSRRLIFCFSFFSTLHSYARRNHDVIVADVATSAIVYRPSVVAKFRKTAKADGALLVFHFHLALCGCGSLFRCGRYPFIGGFASIVAPRPSGDLLLRAKHLFVAAIVAGPRPALRAGVLVWAKRQKESPKRALGSRNV
jgi:hypothetical protein